MQGGSGDTESYAVGCFFKFSDLLYKTVQQIVASVQLKEQRTVAGNQKGTQSTNVCSLKSHSTQPVSG